MDDLIIMKYLKDYLQVTYGSYDIFSISLKISDDEYYRLLGWALYLKEIEEIQLHNVLVKVLSKLRF